MEVIFQSFISGLPLLLIHFGVTLIMLALGIVIYVIVTPYNEIDLIKKGHPSAALSFSGALVGIAIPLSIAMAEEENRGGLTTAVNDVKGYAIDLGFAF